MIELKTDGNHITIDVREQITRGEHPRGEILKAVDEAPNGTLFEIHVPHKTAPLIAALEGKGMNVVVNQLAPTHYRLMTLKM